MSDQVRARLEARLEETEEKLRALNGFAAELRARLEKGTEWYLSDEDAKRIDKEVEKAVLESRAVSDRWQIEKYGRVLTHEEEQGWVPFPSPLAASGEEVSERSAGR